MQGTGEDNGNILGGGDKLHPLLQPPVLKVLFPKLSMEDIANSRLVCKVWLTESLSSSSWRTNVTLKFTENGIVNKWENPTSTTPLAQFNDFWVDECATKPFKQFHISGWRFEFESVDQSRFLELVGEHVTSLTLSSSRLGGEGYEYVRKLLFHTFPNLECLKMDNCDFTYPKDVIPIPDYRWSHTIPPFSEFTFGPHRLKSLHLTKCQPVSFSMVELLSNFPMLNSLHVDYFNFGYYSDSKPIPKLLNTIKVLRAQDPTKLPIKDLDVGNIHLFLEADKRAECLEILNLFRELKIPLRRLVVSLEITSEPELIHGEIIRDILRQHSSTLQFFGGTGYLDGLCRGFPFGLELGNLTQVEISVGFCDSLNWLKYTPNLQSLYIKRMDMDISYESADELVSNSTELEIDNWTLSTLKNLRFEVRISADGMGKIVKWMPNVESLEIGLDDGMLSIICQHWKQLVRMTDFRSELTDNEVLGEELDDGDEGVHIAPNITLLRDCVHIM